MMPNKLKPTPARLRRQRLDQLMREYKLTSKQVGALLEVDPVTVRRWRCGMFSMSAATLMALEALCAGAN